MRNPGQQRPISAITRGTICPQHLVEGEAVGQESPIPVELEDPARALHPAILKLLEL
jgi:hypothetical protein